MTSRVIPVEPFTLVVFGATGDLARRKLLPALHAPRHRRPDPAQRPHHRRRPPRARSGTSYRGHGARGRRPRRPGDANGALETFLDRIDYVAADAASDDGWDRAGASCWPSGPTTSVVFYLATAPDLFVPDRRAARRARPRRAAHPHRAREADRQERRLGPGRQRRHRHGLPGGAHLPDRPLSRQGDGAEPDGAALRQRPVRAAVERRPYRPCADHGRRGTRRRGPRRLLRHGRRACATWCRTTCCSCSASSPWSRRPRSRPMRCATRS